ncbi:MAG: hypothetical protein V4538_17565 [Bacteroidota bacterium]
MKISGAVIQTKNIKTNTEITFHATYKGMTIYVSTDHGFGKAKYDHLKRYYIEVSNNKNGLFDVDTWEDCHTMKDAIRYALKGACLIPS